MRQPRDLATTLPSPSEMDNYHKCPCLWWLKDRLWIKPKAEIIALNAGRIVDRCFDAWLLGELSRPLEMLRMFDKLVAEHSLTGEDDFQAFLASARDAVAVWLNLYGSVKENVLYVQPKLPRSRGKVDYIVGLTDPLVEVRERKLISPFADIDDEIAKYQLGFQPLAYAADVEETYGKVVECVRFEFLIRSAPARGRYKAMPAAVRREPIYVDDWKKRLWLTSAQWTNFCMSSLDEFLDWEEQQTGSIAFETVPRHTRNCLTKLGRNTYECDFYKACKTNTYPVLMEDHFTQDVITKEGADGPASEKVPVCGTVEAAA